MFCFQGRHAHPSSGAMFVPVFLQVANWRSVKASSWRMFVDEEHFGVPGCETL